LPEGMNDGRHQAENAASPLELVEGRPVVVQAVEELGMDRVRHFDPALVVNLPAVERELLLLGPVKFGEGSGYGITRHVLLAGQGLEEPTANDLEPLVRAGRAPRGLDPSHS